MPNPTASPQVTSTAVSYTHLDVYKRQGILRRAARRGKELPEVLRVALERQASATKAEKPAVE